MYESPGRRTKFEVFETTDELGFSKDSFAPDERIYVHGLLVDKSGDGLGSQEVIVCEVDEYGDPVEKPNGEINAVAVFNTVPNGRQLGRFGSRDEDPSIGPGRLRAFQDGSTHLKAFFEGDATYAPCESKRVEVVLDGMEHDEIWI